MPLNHKLWSHIHILANRTVSTQGNSQEPIQIQITQIEESIDGPNIARLRYQPTIHIDPNTKATTSMAIALEWNVIASNKIWASFTIKYDLIKLYGSYHHNLIFQRSLIFPFWQKKFKTRYNSNQKKNFTNFHYAMRVPYYFKCSKHPPNDQCTIYAYKMSIITQNMLISLKLS